jgi:uncharacterized protein
MQRTSTRARLGRFVALPLAALAGGCKSGPDGGANANGERVRAQVVSALGACTREVYGAFLPAAEALAADTAALARDGRPDQREAARTAWKEAMGLWQEAELFQYGPAGLRSQPGGQAIRDEIYSWPFVGRCLVEQQIVSQGYQAPDFDRSLINVRGLAAAEYLLFYEGRDNACPPHIQINSGGAWSELTPEELDRRKRQYAAAVAAEVTRWARTLADAWDPAKGNFIAQVTSAGSGSNIFRSPQAALNAMSDALFYLEHPVKDVKLARPLGLKDCDQPPCLETLESRFALRSKDHVRRNLDGFEKLAFGCGGEGPEPLGLDDLLRSLGADALVGRLRTGLASARQALAAIPGEDFREALQSNSASVMSVYGALKEIVDLMKTDLASVLDLEIPKLVEGDND